MTSAQRTRAEHLTAVTCHCPVDPEGHPLETAGCESTVKAGTYPSRSRCTGPVPRPSGLAADIWTELAKTANSPDQREVYRRSAAIATAAKREYTAQDARTTERRLEIRTRNAAS